nr:hypothetical protein GCM10025732_13960 [Glycomyces mayteni]
MVNRASGKQCAPGGAFAHLAQRRARAVTEDHLCIPGPAPVAGTRQTRGIPREEWLHDVLI